MSETLIYIIAGEPSGDLLGARLMSALKVKTQGRVRFVGVGGPQMIGEGLDSLFPYSELAVMGGAEIARLPSLWRRLRQTIDDILDKHPDALVTIDSPGFNFRIGPKVKGNGFPIIHYVAPSVWAWRPWRAKKVARFLDHLLALLPFEPPYFTAVGLPCTFVGHPVIEGGAGDGNGPDFRARYGISPADPLVCILPGSRSSETTRMLPVFAETVQLLAERNRGLKIVVPTVDTVAVEVTRSVKNWAVPVIVLENENDKFDAFAAANVALAASGTVALELAIANTPSVVAYRVNPLMAWLGRRLLRVRYANLINILLDREAIPELLQQDCRAERLARSVDLLLQDADARAAQSVAYREALDKLGGMKTSPGSRAAEVVLSILEKTGNARFGQ